MRLKDLNTGHRIEYTFIENDKLKYAQTQVFETIEGLNQRLSELYIISIKSWLNQINS